jgi:hypothetical protein
MLAHWNSTNFIITQFHIAEKKKAEWQSFQPTNVAFIPHFFMLQIWNTSPRPHSCKCPWDIGKHWQIPVGSSTAPAAGNASVSARL